MSRAFFKKGGQRLFLDTVRQETLLSFVRLGKKFGVCPRSFSDWYSEKYSMPYELVKEIKKCFSLKYDEKIKILPQYWYSAKAGKKGGKVRVKIYGNPGTVKGRILGGKRSVLVNSVKKNGFIKRKRIIVPSRTAELAELFGLILGDGGITKHQVSITLNRYTDIEYSDFVKKKFFKVFGVECSTLFRDNHLQLVVSSVAVVEFLLKNGLKIGDKVKNQIAIPQWINENISYMKACVRGLIDTDGCVYIDNQKYKGRQYKNICIDFTNHSLPLLHSVYAHLRRFGIKAKLYRWSLKIRSFDSVNRYYNLIGFDNEKHENKYLKFVNGEVA